VAQDKLFATSIYHAKLLRRGGLALTRRLRKQCAQIAHDDAAGRKWSAANYPRGYTSYGSQHKLHQMIPTFEEFERRVRPHVRAFVRSLELEAGDRPLVMTDCWVNVMRDRCVHGLHLHPHSVVSGTYYVQTPPGSPGIKFEDPRLDRFMAALPRRTNCRLENRWWVTYPAQAGHLVLFESWLRHEVPAHRGPNERVSISFNYGWF
jgi:uncharacterized protein (TIGR02466 family)